MSWKDLLLVPNILTLLRILMIPPGFFFLDRNENWIAGILVATIFLTDFLDGWVARKWNQISQLGSIMDPVADKIVALSFFGYFFFLGELPIFYFILIFLRDVLQLSAVPVLLFWKKIQFQVKPKMIPKWGTALNFIILSILLISALGILPEIFLQYPIDRGSVLLGSLSWKDAILYPLFVISGGIEVYILATFIPRFVAIYHGEHDTFE